MFIPLLFGGVYRGDTLFEWCTQAYSTRGTEQHSMFGVPSRQLLLGRCGRQLRLVCRWNLPTTYWRLLL